MCFNSYKGTIVMKGVSLMNIYYRSASIPIKEQLLYDNIYLNANHLLLQFL